MRPHTPHEADPSLAPPHTAEPGALTPSIVPASQGDANGARGELAGIPLTPMPSPNPPGSAASPPCQLSLTRAETRSPHTFNKSDSTCIVEHVGRRLRSARKGTR